MQEIIKKISHSRWLYFIGIILGFGQAVVFDFSYQSTLLWLPQLFSILSITGFLIIISHLKPRRALKFGYTFGLGLFGWGINWVYISMATFGGAPLIFAIFANGLVIAYLALYWAVVAFLITLLGNTPNKRLLIAPAIIALLEWVRSVFLIGFPWLSIGYGWIDSKIALLGQAGGVFFVTFAVILCISLLLLRVPKHIRSLSVLGACIIGIALPYHLSKNHPEKQQSTTVSLIQGNMPVITEYDDQRMTKNLVQYHLLSEEVLAKKNPDVIIWPEAAIPYYYLESSDFFGDIYALQQQNSFDLITGVPHGNWKDKEIYNSVLLQKEINPAPQFYNKSHLLPFGEYLPFRQVFAFFKDIVEIPMSDFARGEKIQIPFDAGGLSFSPSICFEAVFGDEIRNSARKSDILLNLSNDAWFGRSKAQIQHLNIARMRAIENQKMLVRATNDGRTAIIDTDGKVLKSIPPFKEGVLTATVYGNKTQSLYAKIGDKLIIGLSLVWLLFLLIGRQFYAKKK